MRKIKSLKSVFLVIVAAIVISTTFSSFAVSNNVHETKQSGKMLQKEVFKHQIDTLEKSVARSEDGTLSLNVSPAVVSSLGMTPEDISKFQSGLQIINKKISNGEFICTKNLTLYDKNDTSFVLQGGVNIWSHLLVGRQRLLLYSNCIQCSKYSI